MHGAPYVTVSIGRPDGQDGEEHIPFFPSASHNSSRMIQATPPLPFTVAILAPSLPHTPPSAFAWPPGPPLVAASGMVPTVWIILSLAMLALTACLLAVTVKKMETSRTTSSVQA